jgi:hypothetical protein
MKTLRFEGCSDDTFGEYGVTNEDYDNCASGKPIEFFVSAGDDCMVVVGQYCPGQCGGWLIGVSHYKATDADEHHLPEWPMRFERGARPYSPALIIEAPDDVEIRCLTTEGR